jgi:serine/threonine protein kinase
MTYMTTGRKAGTLRWQAPELLPDVENIETAVQAGSTPQSDVFAFGLVCYEVSCVFLSKFFD